MRRRSGGVTCIAPSGRVLLLRRSIQVPEPGLWSCPAGGIERGEDPLEGAVRELREEAGYGGDLVVVDCVTSRGARTFYNFIAHVGTEFRPTLNWENDAAGWFDPASAPDPMHPGMKRLLRRL